MRPGQDRGTDHTPSAARRSGAYAALAATLVIAAGVLAYLAQTGSRPHRTAMAAVAAGGCLLAAAGCAALARRPARAVLLVAWNVGALAVLAALVILDDDPRSPVAFAFAGPIAAGALSFPARTVAALTLAGVATCGVSLAAVGSTDAAYLTLLLVTLACVGAACAWQARQKQRALDHLAQLSRTDELTGCLNRRGFVEELDARLVRHERYAQPFGLVLLDLDGFKEINDRYGHAAGDDLLRRTTAALCGSLRGSDAVARLGGDEFGVLLDQSDAVAAELVAGRLREQVRRHAAVSAGHAACPDDGAEADTLYRRADGRLYEAKRQPSMSG